MNVLASLVMLGAMGIPGVLLLRFLRCKLDLLEQIAYGFPLGMVASSLALLAAASVIGTLSLELVGFSAVVPLALGAALWRHSGGSRPTQRGRSQAMGWASVLVVGLIVLRWAAYWRTSLVLTPEGLWAGSVNIWGDWSQHLGDVAAFAYGDNFPPTHPRLSGAPYPYHYLTSLTVAAMVRLGLDPLHALPLHSCVLSFFVAIGIYAFARRLTGRESAAAVALVLFVFGGGLGWWYQLTSLLRGGGRAPDLLRMSWDGKLREAWNLPWENMFFALLAPQRGLLYGLPLGLLSLTLISVGLRTSRRLAFILAGATAGLLPFAHLGTLLALALVTPFLCLLFPSRHWAGFFLVWAALSLPQVWLQQSGGLGAVGSLRVQVGWLAPPDPWIWFWFKNIGLFAPLTLIAFFVPGTAEPGARRFLAAFMPPFALANVLVFQPWDWDNTKVLAYCFLASCILVAGLLVRFWERGGLWSRIIASAAVGTMVLSGLLQNVTQALGQDRHLLLSTEELRVAAMTRVRTEPRAVFAAGLRPNHPITMLSGRRVVLGFPGWMWSQGLRFEDRERALREIYAPTEEAPRFIKQYGVDYVVIGPDERQRFAANVTEFRARFPTLLRTDNYEVFTVGVQEDPRGQ